jgi:glycogen operon protein
VGWTEWNGKYRDVVRAYWKGEGGVIGELAYRLTGSSDLYGHSGRRPYASINFVTAHDGFTLHDLVSYNEKHNEANGEENRDGSDHNISWNCGVEGPTDDPAIIALRAQQKRNFLATLFFSQGVPMLLAGDEMGRTQGGNNNTYCQDNELNWINWDLKPEDSQLIEFTQRIIKILQRHPVFRRRSFFQGQRIYGSGIKDIIWLKPDGTEMTDQEWQQSYARCLGLFLAGAGLDEYDDRGRPIKDVNFLLLLNAHHDEIGFVLPAYHPGMQWKAELDTSRDAGLGRDGTYEGKHTYPLQGRSLALLREVVNPPPGS